MTEHKPFVFKFEDIEVRESDYALTRAGATVKVEPTAFRVLLYLLRNPGRLVTKDEIMTAVWHDTAVSDNSLTRSVATLRRILDDSSREPRYIATVQTLGYRFLVPVETCSTTAEDHASRPDEPPPATTPDPRNSTTENSERTESLRHRNVWAGFIALALLAAIFFVWVVFLRGRTSSTPSQSADRAASFLQILPLTTNPGIAQYPAISPEGGAVAYVGTVSTTHQPEVYVHLIGADRQLQVTHSNGGRLGMPVWSPDSSQIAFTRCNGKNNGVFAVPALGGAERKLTDGGCPNKYHQTNPLAWLSNGQTILMIDRCTAEGAFGVVAVTLATGEKHCIVYSTNMPGSKSIISAFALSPDEKTIAFLAPSPVSFSEVFTVPITGGPPRQITREGPIGGCSKGTDVGCTGLAWAPDSQSILFGRNLDEQGSLWAVAANGGNIYRETHYPAVGSFSKDGRRLVFSAISASTPQAIWRADLSTPEGRVLENRPIVRTLLDEADAQPSPDNSQIAWMSIRTGVTEIWTSSATGENPFQVTHMKAYTGTPRWSPDGKMIAFDSVTPQIKAGPQIHLIDADGRNLRKITQGEFDGVVPSWSNDGKSIYFASNRSGIWQVWKHSLENGSEAQVTKHGGFNAFESPDGRTIYFSRYEEAGIWSVPRGGGMETLVIADKPQAGYWGYWAITQRGLYFLNVSSNPRYRIEFYDFGSHRTTPVLTLAAIPPALQPSLSATLDGRSIFYTQQDFESVLKLAKLSP